MIIMKSQGGMIRQLRNTADWKLINDYKRMKTEKGSGRAIIAMTRKVSRIVFAMLQTMEKFNPELMRSINKIQQTA